MILSKKDGIVHKGRMDDDGNMLREKKRVIFIMIMIVLAGCAVLTLLLISAKTQEKPAVNGAADLTEWDGESVLLLSGEWDFYWNQFLDENALSQNSSPDLLATVPSVWNKIEVNGEKLGGYGYATYRLRVTGVKAGMSYAMRILPFSTAYNLYIDDALVASSGKISTTTDGFKPQYQVETVTFMTEKDEFDIILHVTNFVYARGGAWYTIYFGNPEKITHISQDIFARDFFVLSCLMLISGYSIFLFFLRRDKGYILFIGLCLVFLLRTVINGNYLINYILPSILFRMVICIDYITLYWLPGLCVWLFRYIYPKNMSRIILRFLMIYAAVFTLLTLALPVHIFTNFIYIAELIAAVSGIYGVSEMLLLTLQRKREAFFMFAGGSALTICIFHDVLCENNLIKTGYVELSSMGFLALAILLQCMFWVRYDRSNKENTRMLLELSQADERERKLELQFLKSQIRPHFINNALNAIISITRTDAIKGRKLLVEFSKYLQNCYSVQSLDDKVPIENELSFVHAYVELEQARFPDSLHINYDIDDMFLQLPPLTLQPLVENAIIHGIKGKSGDGHVLIYVKDCGDFVKVGVTDDGIGIKPENAAALLSTEHNGAGVGINNINRRMKRIYGTGLHLESRPEGGCDAYIIIPKEGETLCEPY